MKRLREYLQAKFLTALTFSPVLLRWFATRHSTMQGLPGLEYAFMTLDQAGRIAELDGPIDECKPSTLLVPVYLVMVTIKLTTGGSTLWPLTPFFFTFRAAERFQNRLARTHPRCAVQCSMMSFDALNPHYRDAIKEYQRQLVAETLQNAE